MGRIPEDELERLKRESDLSAIIRSKGVELNKHGSKDLIGLCPFHGDQKTPNFVVTPAKNLWHCMGCGKGGSVIDFMMEYEGVSFRHAFELLRDGASRHLLKSSSPLKKATIPKLEAPIHAEADDQTALRQVIEYYHERLLQSPNAMEYLQSRGIASEEAIKNFKIGFADRTLGLRLPHANRAEGQQMRERLKRLGILRESTGHEHFNGCITFPIVSNEGKIEEIYGRKIIQKQRTGIYHLYLPGPHKGIWNPRCLQYPEIILCESIIDTLSFWVNGYHNVTCIYGTEGFNDEHLQSFIDNKTQVIRFAYDNDKAGNRAVERDAERLLSVGIECYRIDFPKGMDANEYVRKVTPGGQSLQVLINSATWLGSSKKSQSINTPSTISTLAANKLAAKEKKAIESRSDETPVLIEQDVNNVLSAHGQDYLFHFGDREYRIRGLHKNSSFEVLKINLRVMCDSLFHVNVLDLYHAKQRKNFIEEAAFELRLKQELLKKDLGKVLLELEGIQEKRILEELNPKDPVVEMKEQEQADALRFLKSSNLVAELLNDFEACGIVGENSNKQTAWLACVSRKLRKPLAVIIQSTSAAGKSTLMEAVLQFLPPEEQVKYSAMTGQSLYYLGESNLKHKILAIVEEEGAERASYALKLLQSEGELTIASTGKDPDTGRMKTEEYHVEGPVMIFLTTTAIDIDEELMNRCLVLTVDEGQAQTERIHRLQRESRSEEGMVADESRKLVIERQRNVQRLLKPYRIVNDYARELTFVSTRTRSRRDHEKYLTLIDTITLVHQYQRKVEYKEVKGQRISFIRTTLDDIEIANRLAPEVLGRSLDELPPQTRRLLGHLKQMVGAACKERGIDQSDYHFSRRHLREYTGWSQTQIKVHLDRLQDLEYIAVHNGGFGKSFEYELLVSLSDEEQKHRIGLLNVDDLRRKYGDNLSGLNGNLSEKKPHLTGGVQTAPTGDTIELARV